MKELSNNYNFQLDIVYMRYGNHVLMSGNT